MPAIHGPLENTNTGTIVVEAEVAPEGWDQFGVGQGLAPVRQDDCCVRRSWQLGDEHFVFGFAFLVTANVRRA